MRFPQANSVKTMYKFCRFVHFIRAVANFSPRKRRVSAPPSSRHSGTRDLHRARPFTLTVQTRIVWRGDVRTGVTPPSRRRQCSPLQLVGLRVRNWRIFLRGFRRDVRRGRTLRVLAVPESGAHAYVCIVRGYSRSAGGGGAVRVWGGASARRLQWRPPHGATTKEDGRRMRHHERTNRRRGGIVDVTNVRGGTSAFFPNP